MYLFKPVTHCMVEAYLDPLRLKLHDLLVRDRAVEVPHPVLLGEVRPEVVRGPADRGHHGVVVLLIALWLAEAGAVHLRGEERLHGVLGDALCVS